MRRDLESYSEIVGDEIIAEIHRKARRLYGKHVVHINSTYQGGGVAEMLSSLIPLMNDIGIDTGWRILHGNPDFFVVTKKIHNALQGDSIHLTGIKKRLYLEANDQFSKYTHINHDCVIIHDPQPLPLLHMYKKHQPWVWRCHIDLSDPDPKLWEFLKNFILKYDVAIISNEDYRRKDLPVDQRIIYPAINPLSAKNKDISRTIMEKTLKKFNIPADKPLITQISRFDIWKDPLNVIEVFKRVKQNVDCRLVLCGSMAVDDPEGWKIYKRTEQKARSMIKNKEVFFITSENSILVNTLQRMSAVVIQKSIREGFGLTVTEALWKGTPVVASNIGGIPLQIQDGQNGFLLDPVDLDGFADRIIRILQDKELARQLGENGREFVRRNFLITRLLSNYLDLIGNLLSS